MTLDEAIEILDSMKVKIDIPNAAVTQRKRNEALEMAIRSLTNDECVDAISRKAALVQVHHNKTGDDDIDVIIEKDIATIQTLPPVIPKQKTGK